MQKKPKSKSKKAKADPHSDTQLWESRKLGASMDHAVVAPKDVQEKISLLIEEGLDLQAITIRIPTWVINHFKKTAPRAGLKYQTSMRIALIKQAEEDLKKLA